MSSLIQSFISAFQNLRSNFLQTILSMLGVIIGVGALVAMLSVIDGLEHLARTQLAHKTPLETLSFSAATHTRVDGIRVKKDSVAKITAARYESFMEELPFEAKGQLSLGGSALTKGDSGLIGITYRAVTLPLVDNAFDLAEGRWLEPSLKAAIEGSGPVDVLINHNLALKLVAPDTAVLGALDREFEFLGATVKVVGISEPSDAIERNGLLFDYNKSARFPKLINDEASVSLSFADVTEVLPAKAYIEAWAAKEFEGVEEPLRINTYTNYLEDIQEGFLIFRLVMGFIIGIAVVVGGVGIMNVLVMSVVERTTEIGIRKALGATRKAIMSQFLFESVALSVIGSAFGTVLGMLVALGAGPVVEMFADNGITFTAVFTWQTMLVVSVVAVMIGMLFGTYPALRASKLDPVLAIRRL